MRDGRRTPAAVADPEGTAQERRLRPAARQRHESPSRAARRSEAMTDRRITTIAGDVGTDGLGLSDDDRAIVRRRPTSSSTPPPRCRSTRRSTRRSRSTCSGRPASPSSATTLGITPHLVAVSHVLRRRQPPRIGPRAAGQRGTVRHRARLAGRGRRLAAPQGRHRGRQPHARSARRSSARRPAPSSAPPAHRRSPPRPSSSASRWVKDQLIQAGRLAGRERRLARRLRLHEGARRAGAVRVEGRRAGVDRAPVDHRVGVGRAASRAGSAGSAWPSR